MIRKVKIKPLPKPAFKGISISTKPTKVSFSPIYQKAWNIPYYRDSKTNNYITISNATINEILGTSGLSPIETGSTLILKVRTGKGFLNLAFRRYRSRFCNATCNLVPESFLVPVGVLGSLTLISYVLLSPNFTPRGHGGNDGIGIERRSYPG
jgi:hypothetical protein